ncbi:MAG: hypothetical protein FJ217_07935 [Ignavibacteria bacterium]|nr:hypothetical protein [Ignavibacteria bacterium]
MPSATTEPLAKQVRTLGLVLFLLSAAMYGFTTYGGVRSSDSEVVFRVAESLARDGEFSVEHELEEWKAFGVAYGRGGKLYSIFGPLESILLAPFVKVADLINDTGWYEPYIPILPLSQFTEKGFFDLLQRSTTKNPRPHALRMLTSVFNVLVTALTVFVFWRILLLLTKSLPTSFLVSLTLAFGTLAWPYSGTFFSEPLATLLVLVSFYYLIKSDNDQPGVVGPKFHKNVFFSGLWLGLAITAHITASLFAPFFAFYFFWQGVGDNASLWQRLERAAVFSFGVYLLLFLLGLHNYARFGDFFETGRTVSATSAMLFGYGTFVSPIRGMFGLLFGAGKGLIFFTPIAVVGTLMCRSFHREHRKLFFMVAAAVFFRMLFIASRSDWHAGFCIGPRYLLMVIPFFLIPIALWLKNQETVRFGRSFGLMTLGAFLCSIEQLYFSLGEIFSYLQILKFAERWKGIDVFESDLLYLNWAYSPLLTLKDARVSPFLLRYSGHSVSELLLIGAVVLAALFLVLYLMIRKMPRRELPVTSMG